MELVIDANRVIAAALAPGGNTAELLFSNELHLFAPEFLREELDEHEDELVKKSGLSKAEFDIVVTLVFSRISLIPFDGFKECLPAARHICPDPDDTEYFALALKRGCAVWSEDKRLKAQSAVKILSTGELISLLSL